MGDWSSFRTDSAKKLGEGGTAVVYEYRGCAVKVAHDDESCLKELLNEQAMLEAAKDVRGCARAKGEVQEINGRHILPMELIAGHDLERVLAGGARGPEDPTGFLRDESGRVRSEATARWAAQLCEFVASMRAAQPNALWHGDLKAKNIRILNMQTDAGGQGDICVLDFAGGGSAADVSPAHAASELQRDENRLRQLLAQLEWQCNEHEALVVAVLHKKPKMLSEQYVSRGWQLLSYVNTLADDAAARNRFLERDPIVRRAFVDSAEEGVDPFDFFFDFLMDSYLDNPESVAEQAGVDVAASRRSAEQLVEEREARRLFQAAREAPEAL